MKHNFIKFDKNHLMKTFLLVAFFACLYHQSLAQEFEGSGSCDFEEPCTYLKPIADSSFWEIGNPEKININGAYSPTMCLVTDVLEPVTTNQLDYVQFDIPSNKFGETPTYLEISFNYKSDLTDSLDFCDVEMAFDTSDYNSLIYLTTHPETPYYSYISYSIPDYKFTPGDSAITGTTEDWRIGEIEIIFYFTVKPQGGFEIPLVDTVHLRFQLRTDSIDDGGDGIAIDNFAFQFQWWGAVEDVMKEETLAIFPNPASSTCIISSATLSNSIQTIQLYSVYGEHIASLQNQFFDASGKTEISVEGLPPGTYMCAGTTKDTSFKGMFVKL